MSLVEPSDRMPEPKRGWSIWGVTARSDMIPLGEKPRLSLGQKLRSTYKRYYQVDMRVQELNFECPCRSATGEIHFPLEFEISFKILPDRVPDILMEDISPEAVLKKGLRRQAEAVSEEYAADNKMGLQTYLRNVLNQKQTGEGLIIGPFLLTFVSVTVRQPEGMRSQDELDILLIDLRRRLPVAELEGKKEEAIRLRRAIHALEEADKVSIDDSISIGVKIKEFTDIINDLSEERGADDPVVRTLEANMSHLVQGASSSARGTVAEAPPQPRLREIDPYDAD